MRAENGVFPSDWALGDFYAILSVKISALRSAAHGGDVFKTSQFYTTKGMIAHKGGFFTH